MEKINKLIIFFLLSLFLINFISAASDVTLVGKKGENITLSQECVSCTFVKISSIQYPNMTREYIGKDMAKNDSSFTYEFNKTESLGKYNYCGYGDSAGTNTTFCYDFTVTYAGKELTTEKAIIYFIFLILFVLIFIGAFIFIGFLPSKNEKDEQGRIMTISYLKYFRNILYMFEWMLFIAIVYMFSNLGFAFLEEEMFSLMLFRIFQICLSLTPLIVIVWFAWILVSLYHDREFQKYLNRGIFPQGDL